MTRIAIVAVAVAIGAALVASCSSAATQCDCADPGATIAIPSDQALAVSNVALSGPACEGVTPTCESQPCATYRFAAKAAGSCHVEVDFADGHVFNADVTFGAASESCCQGFYATPLSAAQIAVPASDGGA